MQAKPASLKSYWELLSRHIRPQRGAFALLAVLLFGNIGLQIANPQIMRTFIDAALAANRLHLRHLSGPERGLDGYQCLAG
jgi:hypothetical protein